MSNVVVKVENLSKIYRLYEKPVDRLKESLNPFKKKYHRDFFALKDVSFSIKKGEIIGIIGKNGSGKSTLLKIITGVLTATSGSVQVYGRISALLELGAGFNSEYTGIQNIYLNGTMMGLTTKEIDKKIPEIVNFADIGDFINQPVKTYSSGMFVRLAFSVAINVDPDILIVDEALAVGDIRFQQKCFAKFDEFIKKGKTIIFVSHSIDTVKMFCSHAILLNEGKIVCEGNSKDVCNEYLSIMRNAEAIQVEFNESKGKSTDFTEIDDGNLLRIEKLSFYNKYEKRYGKGGAVFSKGGLFNLNGNLTNEFYVGEDMVLDLEFEVKKQFEFLAFGYGLRNLKGQDLFVYNGFPQYDNYNFKNICAGDIIRIRIKQNIMLIPGDYTIAISLAIEENGEIIPIDIRYDVMMFKVYTETVRYYAGIFYQNIDIAIL